MSRTTGLELLSGCACRETRAPFAATPVTRRSVLAGGTAVLSAAAMPAAAQTPAKPHRIDVHHHIIPPVQAEAVVRNRGGNPVKWTVSMSLEDMDKAGVATSI